MFITVLFIAAVFYRENRLSHYIAWAERLSIRILMCVNGTVLFFLRKVLMFVVVFCTYREAQANFVAITYHTITSTWRGAGVEYKYHMKLKDRPFWPWFCYQYYFYWEADIGRISTKSTWKNRYYTIWTKELTKDFRVVYELPIDFFYKYAYVLYTKFKVILPITIGDLFRKIVSIVIATHMTYGVRGIVRRLWNIKKGGKFFTKNPKPGHLSNLSIVPIFYNTKNYLTGITKLYPALFCTALPVVYLFLSEHTTNTVVVIVTSTILYSPILILWQTFVFFFKSYQISKFTSANQSFWKRALFLFWAIEGFLFLIVYYINFIAPDNLRVGVNHSIMYYQTTSGYLQLLESVWVPVLLLGFTRALLVRVKTTDNLYFWATLTIVLTFYMVVSDLEQLFGVYSYSRDHYTSTNPNNMGSEEFVKVDQFREDLVTNQVSALLVFIKFWHVIFIASFIVFVLLRNLETGITSFDLLSATFYNINYLFLFNLSFFVYTFKQNVTFILTEPSYFYGTSISFTIIRDVCTCIILNLSCIIGL